MAYNTLSGTVVANRTVVFQENGGERDDPGRNRVMGEFHGDGTYIENVARIVVDNPDDSVITRGTTAQSLVAENNLKFNGSRLYINGDLTASAVGLSSDGALPNSFLALDSSNNVVLTSSGGGSGGSIGASEDGNYEDGLFMDFSTSTPVGTAVDRFNEVLKALAPSPSPSLDNIGTTNYGATAKLSFGYHLVLHRESQDTQTATQVQAFLPSTSMELMG
ncbi:MAG: hypothetical protein ACXACD_21915 [Candidatus Thorarchaeota archaeon]|jgi:hypothetical protein